jgi:UDP:flavonoid glycosyltransferase YjiC (YdhE family)
MRVLLTAVPGLGHFHSLAPLAAAALRRGDEVVIATGENLADWVQSCGFEFAPVGLALPSALAETQKRFAGPEIVFRYFTTVAVPPMAQDLLGLANTWRPDLIIHEETEYAAPLVAKLLGLPCVTQSYTAPARPVAERAAMRSFLDPIWSDHGAGPVQLSGEVYLDACPPGFQTDDVISITGLRPIRPMVFDGPTAFPPDRVTTARRPAAYVTFGTIPLFSRPDVLRETVNAMSEVVATMVVTTGPNPAAVLDGCGSSVIVEKYLPQSALLPYVDVVVSHGGAGTTLGAIVYGVPHVVLPQQTMSQLRNAQKIDSLGLGVAVTADAPAGAIVEAVCRVLSDDAFRASVARTRAAIDELPHPDKVLGEIAGLVE